MTTRPRIERLSDLVEGQEADVFACLSTRDALSTREGKPYFRVAFRDARRTVTFPIWHDGPWFAPCESAWKVGEFYKLRCVYRETSAHGPQLELKKVRPATAEDAADGFDRWMLLPKSSVDPVEAFDDLVWLAQRHIRDNALAALVVGLLTERRATLLDMAAAVHHHHATRGGFVEHLASVARNAVFLAEKYGQSHPETFTDRSRDVAIAGAILHDIGKLHELKMTPAGAVYTSAGELIGHALLGRDLVREAATKWPIEPETLLRLEHLIVAHQRTPEWGAAKPPMTPEAWLVYFADDVDARLQMVHEALAQDAGGWITGKKNALGHKVFRESPPE